MDLNRFCSTSSVSLITDGEGSVCRKSRKTIEGRDGLPTVRADQQGWQIDEAEMKVLV